ncbi:MAG: hypothetical protein ABF804_07810 [Liquorilactobacillus ghanensis]|uniref:hypothetical protein n=1 Tax=Liquorilactobacillus ghanensis TaxID=399370 RepID=UPI0039EC7394
MNRKYGNPNSLIQSDLASDNFKINVNSQELPSFSKMANHLLSSRTASKQFLRDPTKYMVSNGCSKINSLNITDNNFDVLRVISAEDLNDAVQKRDAQSFVETMIRLEKLPKYFIQRTQMEPRAAWVPVVVTPAVAYTSFGAVAWVVAAVAALVKVGVKGAFTPVYKSTVLQPDIAWALSMAVLMADSRFAHQIDDVLWARFLKEIKSISQESDSRQITKDALL